MAGYGIGNTRGIGISGTAVSSYLDRVDGRRKESARSPLQSTRDYGGQGQGGTPAPRQDLLLNLNALQPAHDVKVNDLNYIADTMRYGDFAHIPFSVGVNGSATPILTRAQTKRTFLLIQNTHAVQDLFIGFDVIPSLSIGIKLAAGGTLVLDSVVAQNDVYLSGSGAQTTGLLTYCNQAYGQA